MSNMSYCRFENTDRDLADCQNTLEGMIQGDEGALSDEELRAAKRLVERCLDIARTVAESIGEDDLDLNERQIEQALDSINSELES